MAQYIPDNTKGYEPDLDNLVLSIKGNSVLYGCAVAAQASPDMTVAVAVGSVRGNGTVQTVSAGNLTISAADSSNSRIDIISVDYTTGTKAVTAGTPASTPKPPSLPTTSILLAYVSVAAAATNIQNSNISDRRITAESPVLSGLAANRPTAANVPKGTIYFSTDTNGGELHRSDQTSWTQIAQGVTESVAHKTSHVPGGSDVPATIARTASTNATGAVTVDFSAASTIEYTLTGNTTFTFTAPAAGTWIALILKQDATGSRIVTWPGSVKWSGGTAPTLTTTAAKYDVLVFYYDGTNYFGQSSLNY